MTFNGIAFGLKKVGSNFSSETKSANEREHWCYQSKSHKGMHQLNVIGKIKFKHLSQANEHLSVIFKTEKNPANDILHGSCNDREVEP